MVDITDSNGKKTYTGKFRCWNCSHDFTADVCWDVTEFTYRKLCPNCGNLNDVYCWTGLSEDEDNSNLHSKSKLDFSLENMKDVADKIAKKLDRQVMISVNYINSIDDSNTFSFNLYIIDIISNNNSEYFYDTWEALIIDWADELTI